MSNSKSFIVKHMLEKLKKLKRELSTYKYQLLIRIMADDIKFHKSIGSIFTEKTLSKLVDNALMIVNRF